VPEAAQLWEDEPQPTSLPKIPDASNRTAIKTAAKSKAAAPTRPPADRSKLDAAENALRKLEQRRKGEEAYFRREEDELEARRKAAQRVYVDARKAATAKVVEARTAYRKAGGGD
jgi:hypothetical protein